jgi:hypothetical protein
MTRFALVLVACVPCVALRAQEKSPATELEGTWQEPARPGATAAAVRYKITFAGEKVTVSVCDRSLTGRFDVEAKADPPILTVVSRSEAGKLTIVRGRYELKDGRLILSIGPEESVESPLTALRVMALERSGGTEKLDRGPVRLTLEKVKK